MSCLVPHVEGAVLLWCLSELTLSLLLGDRRSLSDLLVLVGPGCRVHQVGDFVFNAGHCADC